MIEGVLSNGIYYRTNDFEAGKECAVFVHGLSGSSSAWLDFEKRLSPRYNVVSFDLRGHGKSIRYGSYSDYAIEKNTDDLCLLLEHLRIERFHLISHSYGALIALDYLSSFQDRVKSATFLSPGIFIVSRMVVKLIKPFLDASKIIGYLPLLKKNGEHIDYSGYVDTGDWNVRRMIADVGNTGLRAYLFCSRQAYDFKKSDFFDRIVVPTLIIHGERDTVFPVGNSIAIAKRIRNCDLVLLPEADHILVLNHFPEISAAIESFLEKAES